ncbi:MAG: T9SS type A sorting domain-containing protein [Cytophagales bacterium]|nr:T9SS type A sorting domain-containing protein [Cytophagales bacterium]
MIKRIAPAVSAPGSTVKVTLKVPTNFQFINGSSVQINFRHQNTGYVIDGYCVYTPFPKTSPTDTLANSNYLIPTKQSVVMNYPYGNYCITNSNDIPLGYYDAILQVLSCPSFPYCMSGNNGNRTIIATQTLTSALLLTESKTIQGKVFYDKNSNGTMDVSEPTLKYFDVKISSLSTSYNSSTDQNGNYTFYVPSGTYTVSPVFTSSWTSTSTNPRVITINNSSVSNVNFGVSSSISSTSITSNFSTWRFRCGSTVTGNIGYGVNDGGIVANGSIKFLPDPLATVLSFSPMYNSTSGDTLIWNVTDLIPYDWRNIQMSIKIPNFNFIGQSMSFGIKTFNGSGSISNTYTYKDIIRCSYDPNDITLYSTGRPNPDSLLLTTPYLDYQIRFENKGNDTAYVVSVVDTLDANLDFNSFQMLGASHPVNVTKNATAQRIEFRFNNIMLPYTKIDSIKSQGFVKFRVRQKPNLTSGSRIKAVASIYFDANPAVVTNTLNTVFANNLRVATQENELSSINILIFPNPTNGELNIYSETSGITLVELFDIYGAKVAEKIWNPSVNSIDISHLSSGSYIYSISNSRGNQIRGLVIKN